MSLPSLNHRNMNEDLEHFVKFHIKVVDHIQEMMIALYFNWMKGLFILLKVVKVNIIEDIVLINLRDMVQHMEVAMIYISAIIAILQIHHTLILVIHLTLHHILMEVKKQKNI